MRVDNVLLVVDHQNLPLAAFESVRRNLVVFHELVQCFPRNAAELRAWYSEALELTVIEAADDSLLANLADLRGFTGREHGFHRRPPCRLRPARVKEIGLRLNASRQTRSETIHSE